MFHVSGMIFIILEELYMNKTYSMSIRVSEDELEKIKRAAELESYSSYSEFVRRTVLLETAKILDKDEKQSERRKK